jgi:hypothetical protein
MKKLSLDAESLRVESFSTAGEPTERGTVNAREWSRGVDTCYCTSVNIGCWCTEDVTCAHCD